MKIGLIINSMSGGGAERVVQTLSAHYLYKGHEVYIFFLDADAEVYHIDKRVQLIRLKSSAFKYGAGMLFFLPVQAVELYYALKAHRIDCAISFLVRSNITFSLLAIFYKKNVCISERNYSELQYNKFGVKNLIMNWLIRMTYRKATRIVCISNGIADSLTEFYAIDRKILVTIYNPIDLVAIHLQSQVGGHFHFVSGLRYFITAGRLIRQKDHVTLIQAFSIVAAKEENVRLIILGEGPERDALEKLCFDLGLSKKVFLLGFVENPYWYFSKSDVFVFSSLFEGFGNVLVEAMALGLPVISTNCLSGPSEILEQGRSGVLVDVKDHHAMGNAMLALLQDDDKYYFFKTRSLQRASQFDVNIIGEQYIEAMCV